VGEAEDDDWKHLDKERVDGKFAEGMCKYGGYTIAEIKKARDLLNSRGDHGERKQKARKKV
jgi:hypothetical protein